MFGTNQIIAILSSSSQHLVAATRLRSGMAIALGFFLLCLGCTASEADNNHRIEPKTGPIDEKKLKDEISSSIGMKLRLIRPGTFIMGAPANNPEASEFEKPRHEVKLTRPYYLGKYEVTIGEFRRFVKETNYKTDAEKDNFGVGAWKVGGAELKQARGLTWKNPGYPITENHPVTCVSWKDAEAFCRWLSKKDKVTYRLPTEAEWEHACRAGTKTLWWFGDSKKKLDKYAWYNKTSGRPQKVGQKPANPLGLHDMLGNVREACHDYELAYPNRLVVDPQGAKRGTVRMMRGGDAFSPVRDTRASTRGRTDARVRMNFMGFRVCRPQ